MSEERKGLGGSYEWMENFDRYLRHETDCPRDRSVLLGTLDSRCGRGRVMSRDRRGASREYVLYFVYIFVVDTANTSGLGEWVTIPCTYAGGAKGESGI